MKKQDIKRHLKAYSIYGKRKTTINHAFASALSVADVYDESKIDEALELLGQDPNSHLSCAYCARPADTWDHITAVVKNGNFSGYGHQISNLLPCCKACNSQKGNRDWKTFLSLKYQETGVVSDISAKIEAYIKANSLEFKQLTGDNITEEIAKLDNIKHQIFDLMQSADKQASLIRKMLKHNEQ